MKAVFFGTPEFVVPVLDQLVELESISVTAVVTKSDSPIGTRANSLGIPALTLAELEAKLQEEGSLTADIFIVAAFGEFLSPFLINYPRYKTLNLHPSLLPKLRGTSPMQTAILEDFPGTGITVMQMDEKMDHGPIIAQAELPLTGQEIFPDLARRLFSLGADLLAQVLPLWVAYMHAGEINQSSPPASPAQLSVISFEHHGCVCTGKVCSARAFTVLRYSLA